MLCQAKHQRELAQAVDPLDNGAGDSALAIRQWVTLLGAVFAS
jgi:hypothetical protein